MTDQSNTHERGRRQIEPGNSRPVEPGMKTIREALSESAARHASLQERVITVGELISIIDTLGAAQTRCAALNAWALAAGIGIDFVAILVLFGSGP